MKPAPFDYLRPSSVDEACRVLAESGGGAQVLAGGQTLLPLLNLRMAQPFVVVDLCAIADLRGISDVDGGIRIGAMTRQADALADPLLARRLPALVTALGHVGHHQTRNRGTVGGSLALGEPAAELPACAVALGAELEIASPRGVRRIPARDFYLGPYMTVLEPDEVLTASIWPDWAADHRVLFREVARRPGDFALVGMVGALEMDGSRIGRAALGWFAMGPTPVAMMQAEAALAGADGAGLDLASLADLALADCAPFDDQHASAEYRRTVGRRVFIRVLSEALGRREAA